MPTKRSKRPPFAEDFPDDDELEELLIAFEQGNYARVRSEAPKLALSSPHERVRKAATALRRRIDPDPLAIVLMLLAVGLLVMLAGFYFSHRAPR